MVAHNSSSILLLSVVKSLSCSRVDTMDARKLIGEVLQAFEFLLVDSRMASISPRSLDDGDYHDTTL